MKITRNLGATALAGALLGLSFGVAANAAETEVEHYPATTWVVSDWTGATAVPASKSKPIDATTVALTKPSGAVGTSIETGNLGLAGGTVTVHYTLSGGAATAAGAIRMFAYDNADAETATEAPDKVDIAQGTAAGGTLTFDIAGTVGTFGLTYDASNDSAGTVTFTHLMVGETEVLFKKPVAPSPSASTSASPSASPSTTSAPSPSATTTTQAPATTAPAPSQSTSAAGLPVTGDSGAKTGLVVGAILVLVGGAAIAVARRRRVNFEA